MLRLAILLLLALPTLAAPVVDRIAPSYGFRFGATNVVIHGSGFTSGRTIFCHQEPCPVQVSFGPYEAQERIVTPTEIHVTVAPLEVVPDGRNVDVRVTVNGQGETVIAHGFSFYDASEGRENYEQYLVPITGETIAGANGSQWRGELTFFNGSAHNAVLIGKFAPPGVLTPPIPDAETVAPRGTSKPILYGSGATAGAFLYVPKPLAGDVRKSLRIRDLSRNANSWGTEIPIVRIDEVGTTMTLIDIPTDPQYRATLRIYHWSAYPGVARVTIYAPDRAEPVSQFDVESHAPFPPQPEVDMPFYPSYSQVDLLTPAVRAAGPSIRVEVYNYGDNPRVSPPFPAIWAFVSVTNNETQQVTVMTP
ncbi:MAG TPA: IPT/TIG domain-containing protein [Thermoanaerobaculia bacterium]|nr:IPT/TIG domain-containing protein [Thermoanaerobaculia bacterium]